MGLDQLVDELNDILPLLELAQADHPEDYNLEIIYERITKILEDHE